MDSGHDEALRLAEELLTDIELRRLEPMDIARKASRLARLTDDVDAMSWLSYEVSGYPEGISKADHETSQAARRSNRRYLDKESRARLRISGIGEIQASIETATLQLNPVTNTNTNEQTLLRMSIIESRGILDRIIGSLHTFASTKYQELRFGAAVETVFEGLRVRVDADIARLVPDALPILTTALENVRQTNPVQWGNAAKACRDLIKAVADALRPPSKSKNGRSMTEANYINRLIDWIETYSSSSTARHLTESELNDLGNRLDAVTSGGHKGAHAEVSKQEASRLIIGTYVLIGDILMLHDSISDINSQKHKVSDKIDIQDSVIEAES